MQCRSSAVEKGADARFEDIATPLAAMTGEQRAALLSRSRKTSPKRPAASVFNQLCSVWSESPKVLAAEETVWPPWTRRTASCLNSSVYRARTIPVMQTPPMPILINQPWGTFFRGKVSLTLEPK